MWHQDNLYTVNSPPSPQNASATLSNDTLSNYQLNVVVKL